MTRVGDLHLFCFLDRNRGRAVAGIGKREKRKRDSPESQWTSPFIIGGQRLLCALSVAMVFIGQRSPFGHSSTPLKDAISTSSKSSEAQRENEREMTACRAITSFGIFSEIVILEVEETWHKPKKASRGSESFGKFDLRYKDKSSSATQCCCKLLIRFSRDHIVIKTSNPGRSQLGILQRQVEPSTMSEQKEYIRVRLPPGHW